MRCRLQQFLASHPFAGHACAPAACRQKVRATGFVRSLLLAACTAGFATGEQAVAADPISLAAAPKASKAPDVAGEPTAADALTAAPRVPTTDTWTLAIAPAPDTRGDERNDYRWRHVELDEQLARPLAEQPDYVAAMSDNNPVVAANAAIVMARRGDATAASTLMAAIRTSKLKLSLRAAAVEALARLPADGNSPQQELRALLDQYGNWRQRGAGYLPELHVELLHALMQPGDPAMQEPFMAALASPAADVRLVALGHWEARPETMAPSPRTFAPLPAMIVDLRGDLDPRLRARVLHVLAVNEHPEALTYAIAALTDARIEVRLGAVAAMGKIQQPAAQTTLVGLLSHDVDAMRAAAVAVLARQQAWAPLDAALLDKSWRVRKALAAELVNVPDPRLLSHADKLLLDSSVEVQQQMVASLADWPLPLAGPRLLTSMEQAGYLARQAAARQLAERWPPAERFVVDAPAERRQQLLLELRDLWQQSAESAPAAAAPTIDHAAASVPVAAPQSTARILKLVDQLANESLPRAQYDQNVAELIAMRGALFPVLETQFAEQGRELPPAVYRDVLPALSGVFAAMTRLAAADVAVRRQAAASLNEQVAGARLGRLAAERLVAVSWQEPDALVWRSLLMAVRGDAQNATLRLVYAGSSHPSPEVRRTACMHLHQHPDPRHATILLAALKDQHPAVAQAAILALGHPGVLTDTAPLEALLTARDPYRRLSVAVSLAKLQAAAGTDALVRLAHDPDAKVRRQAALAMGELKNPAFVSVLLTMLDDQLGVRQAAIDGLEQVTGEQVARAGDDLLTQVTAWRAWHRDQTARAARQPDASAAQ